MRISRAIKSAREYFRRDAEYIAYNKGLIAYRNSGLLRLGCVIYMLVLLLFGILDYFNSASVIQVYICAGLIAFHTAFLSVVFIYHKSTYGNYNSTQRLCIVFEISLLLFFAAEGVFQYPNHHSYYVPIAMFFVMTLFSHPVKYTYFLIVAYCVLFSAASFLYKDLSASIIDMRIAAATLISSLICYTLISISRHNEGITRRRLEYMSSIDTLTGVYNKQTLESLCDALLKNEHRRDYAIIILDMDNFKKINDTYGHVIGDRVLEQVGKTLMTVFTEKNFVGRFGGDEFVVMMHIEKRGAYAVYTKLNMINEMLSKVSIDGLNDKLTCSIGATISYSDEDDNNSFEGMLRRADAALYEAKNAGRNQYRVS